MRGSDSVKKERILWPDIAKGISILGVVQYHAMSVSNAPDSVNGFISSALMPLRLGMFFFVSGMFAYRLRSQSLKLILTKKIYIWMVPYFLWTIISWYIGSKLQVVEMADNPWTALIFPVNGMWFLFALSICTIFVYLTRGIQLNTVFFLALASPLASSLLGMHWTYQRAFRFIPFFVLGLILSERARNLEKSLKENVTISRQIILYGSAFVFYLFALVIKENSADLKKSLVFLPGSTNDQIVTILIYFLALPFGILLALLLSKGRHLSKILSWYGRNTLPIYITNEIFVWSSVRILRNLGWYSALNRDLLVALVFLIAMAGTHIAIYLSRKNIIGWIFIPPPLRLLRGSPEGKRYKLRKQPSK